jgi:hypothetical protein
VLGVKERRILPMFEMTSKAMTPIRAFRAMGEAEKWMME